MLIIEQLSSLRTSILLCLQVVLHGLLSQAGALVSPRASEYSTKDSLIKCLRGLSGEDCQYTQITRHSLHIADQPLQDCGKRRRTSRTTPQKWL